MLIGVPVTVTGTFMGIVNKIYPTIFNLYSYLQMAYQQVSQICTIIPFQTNGCHRWGCPYRVIQKFVNTLKIRFGVGWIEGKTPLVSIEGDVKIKQEVYREVLRDHLLPCALR